MSVNPAYEKYEYTADGAKICSQSIVECRLADWSENKILAVSPSVVFSGAEVVSGEVRYGGKLYFSVVGAAPDGTVIAAERGAEFSHRAECATAAPSQSADVALRVEKCETRREGRAVILSAIVTADISLSVPSEIDYLTGGEGVICDLVPVRVRSAVACRGTVELEEEFDTDYVSDVLLHSEQVCLTRVVATAGSLDVSGEINLSVLAGKEGDNDCVSYERLIPFRAEIPCDEAVTGMPCDARVNISSVNLSCACDEDKNRCRIFARIEADVRGRVYRSEEIRMAGDAFCPECACKPECKTLVFEEPVCAFTASERVSGTAAMNGEIDYACRLQAAALCGAEIAATVTDGEIVAEGVLNASIFYKDAEGSPCCVPISLPFSFPVRSDRARAGMRAEIAALACGVSARQKKEGELEAEGALKLYVTLRGAESCTYVAQLETGDPIPESGCSIAVHVPAAGDTLWETAKKLRKTPEEVQRENPDLKYPLSGGERIVVYHKKEIAF